MDENKRRQCLSLTISSILALLSVIIYLNLSWASIINYGFDNYKYHTNYKGFSIYGDTKNFDVIINAIDYLNITHDEYKTLNHIIFQTKKIDEADSCGQYHSGTREVIIYDCNQFEIEYYASYIYYVNSKDFYIWALSHELGHHKQNIQGDIMFNMDRESIENKADYYAHELSKLGEIY
jgi:uncharacterized membrane protein YjgN (DUF898 family)